MNFLINENQFSSILVTYDLDSIFLELIDDWLICLFSYLVILKIRLKTFTTLNGF